MLHNLVVTKQCTTKRPYIANAVLPIVKIKLNKDTFNLGEMIPPRSAPAKILTLLINRAGGRYPRTPRGGWAKRGPQI